MTRTIVLSSLLACSLGSPASAREDPLYVLVRTIGLGSGVGRIDGYLTSTPTFTHLIDLPGAAPGQLLYGTSIAYDAYSDRLIVCTQDGFVGAFWSIDLATGAIALLFADAGVVQMNEFDIAADGTGYGRHLADQSLLAIDLEAATVTPVLATGGSTGWMLATRSDGLVFAVDSTTLMRVFEPAAGSASIVGWTYLWNGVGMDFTTDERLLAITSTGQMYEVDPGTGGLVQLAFVPGMTSGSGGIGIQGVVDITIAAPHPPGWTSSCRSGTAALFPSGTGQISANELRLIGTELPPGTFAYVVLSTTSQTPASSMMYQGALCLGPPLVRALGTLDQVNASGTYEAGFDLAAFPAPGGTVSLAAGDARIFQVWYRDSGSFATSAFTNAVEVQFQ